MNSNFNNLIFYDSSSDQPYRPPQKENLEQWLSGAERLVGNCNGNDDILLHELPSCFTSADCDITIKTSLYPSGSQWIFNATSDSSQIVCGLYLDGSTLIFNTRGINDISSFANLGSYSTGDVIRVTISGTTITGYVNEILSGSGTIDDITDQINYPFTRFYICSRGNVASPCIGQVWDFSIGPIGDPNPLLIPLNEGEGTDIHDSKGNIVGTLNDQPVTNFWSTKLLLDNSGNGAYGLHDLTQQVVDVAIADRAVGTFDGWDTIRSTQLPDSFVNGRVLRLGGQYRTTALDSVRILWNITLLADYATITYDIFHNAPAGKLYYFYRGIDNVTHNGSICDWDGDGKVVAEISPTTLQVYVNGEACPPVTTEDISGPNYAFDVIYVGGRGPAQNASIIGQHWDFTINDRLIPINETSGVVIYDSDGVLFGTLDDAVPITFRTNGIATKYNLNAHGLVTNADFAGDEWLTRAEISALHNNTTIFTTETEDPIRDRIYSDTTVLTAAQIDANNRKVRR